MKNCIKQIVKWDIFLVLLFQVTTDAITSTNKRPYFPCVIFQLISHESSDKPFYLIISKS